MVRLDLHADPATGLALHLDGVAAVIAARPMLAWRPVGAAEWRRERPEVSVVSALSDRISWSCRLGPCRLELQAWRLDASDWELSARLSQTSTEPIELARVHALEGALAGSGRDMVALGEVGAVGQCRYRRDEAVAAFRPRIEGFWGGMGVHWPRLHDPVHEESDWATSGDVAALVPDAGGCELLFGFTAPATAFGEIGLRTRQAAQGVFVGWLLDGIIMAPGALRELDHLLIHAGDRTVGLERWARACADVLGSRVAPPLAGWCSWYQHWSGVTAEQVLAATDGFAAWPVPRGGRTIQIDDGFQVMPGDWGPNERFRAQWSGLPARIAASGSVPGLWLAPTAIFHRHPVVTEHPDWLQRLPDGQPAVSFSNWGYCDGPGANAPTYFLDPDHPGARAFMAGIIRDAVAAGWRYLKLDFTYALSTARLAHDRSRTAMETMRGLYELFREAAGQDAIICACIGTMGRYATGLVDTARLGGDIGGEWEVIHRNLPQCLDRICTNGVWWNGDPDVFYMRAQDSRLDREESWLLTGTIGLLGGVYLTSDHPGQWDAERTARVRRFWEPQVPVRQCVVSGADGFPSAFAVTHADGSTLVGLYNGGDAEAEVSVSLAELALPIARDGEVSAWPGEGVRLVAGRLCSRQPRHSLRIAHLPGA
jgi:hypothetical protein